MKKIIIVFLYFLILMNLYSQTSNKIYVLHELKSETYPGGGFWISPEGFYFDEVNDKAVCINPFLDKYYFIDFKNKENRIIEKNGNAPCGAAVLFNVGNVYWDNGYSDIYWGTSDSFLSYIINPELFFDTTDIKGSSSRKSVRNIESGFSFILKKDDGKIIYFINKDGIPGAIDTKGKIYTNTEAVEYLKEYDSEKYSVSLKRAEELDLKNEFENAKILVWGKTFYTTTKIREKLYGKNSPYIYDDLIQYDQQGYGYQLYLEFEDTSLCIVNPDGIRIVLEKFEGYKKYKQSEDDYISTSWYVGFGGNIYYYFACKEYTVVFQIQRTWGDPDFYAMAINGYTYDEYGKYVDEILPKLSKADLRILRNTIFALYGVHFKSEDLSKYFEKQVWYTDEGKSSAQIILPAHRQKLVEIIQKMEK